MSENPTEGQSETFESVVEATPETRTRLRSIGIKTLDSLAVADPAALAKQTGLSVTQTTQWVTDARVHHKLENPAPRTDSAETSVSTDPTAGSQTSQFDEHEGSAGDPNAAEQTGFDWSQTEGQNTEYRGSGQRRAESDGGYQTAASRAGRTGRKRTTSSRSWASRDQPSENTTSHSRQPPNTASNQRADDTRESTAPALATQPEPENSGAVESVFDSGWQLPMGAFVLVWGITAGLYGAGDVVTTWYALATGSATESNPIMSAAISIDPAAMIVVKIAILGGLYKLSRELITNTDVKLDSQIALTVPAILSVVGGYATFVNIQNIPNSMLFNIVICIVLVGISGTALAALYEGVPLTSEEANQQDTDQTAPRDEFDGNSRSLRRSGRTDRPQSEQRVMSTNREDRSQRDPNSNATNSQTDYSRPEERTTRPSRTSRRDSESPRR